MIVKDKESFRGYRVSFDDWEIKLQEDFPFMEQDPNDDNNLYRKWGFECSGGWYPLLRECCEAIVARYAKDGIGIEEIDFVPAQIKEKFGTLRFYYGYTDSPCGIAAFDNLATGESIRFDPKSEDEIDDAKEKLRQDIREIVRSAEQKSKYTCERCGAKGELRNDKDAGIFRVLTLCSSCHEKRIQSYEEARKRRKEEINKIVGKKNDGQ